MVADDVCSTARELHSALNGKSRRNSPNEPDAAVDCELELNSPPSAEQPPRAPCCNRATTMPREITLATDASSLPKQIEHSPHKECIIPPDAVTSTEDSSAVSLDRTESVIPPDKPPDLCGTNGCLLLDRHSGLHVFHDTGRRKRGSLQKTQPNATEPNPPAKSVKPAKPVKKEVDAQVVNCQASVQLVPDRQRVCSK